MAQAPNTVGGHIGFAFPLVTTTGSNTKRNGQEKSARGGSSQVVAGTREERARENAAENDAPLMVGDGSWG